MNRQVGPGWLPTLVGVLAFIGSLLVGRALDWALGGVWGTVASLVLIFGAVAAYGAWHRQRAEQRVEPEPHEVPPPAPQDRWPKRLVAVLLMALAAAVIYGPMGAKRSPAPKPAPHVRQQQGNLSGHLVLSPPTAGGWRMVARGEGIVEAVGLDGTLAGWVYYRGDGLAEVYDDRNHLLDTYPGLSSGDTDQILVWPILDPGGRRIGTAVDHLGRLLIAAFDPDGRYMGKTYWNRTTGEALVMDAEGNLVAVRRADGRIETVERKGKMKGGSQ